MVEIDERHFQNPRRVAIQTRDKSVRKLFRVRLIGGRETYEMRASSKAEAIEAVAIATNINANDLEAEMW
jgi:hypothetical protein